MEKLDPRRGMVLRTVSCRACKGEIMKVIHVEAVQFDVLNPKVVIPRPGKVYECLDCGEKIPLTERILEMLGHEKESEGTD